MESGSIPNEISLPAQTDEPVIAPDSQAVENPDGLPAGGDTAIVPPRVFTDKEKMRREQIYDDAHAKHARLRKSAEKIIRITNIRALSAVGLAAQNRAMRQQTMPLDQEEPH